MRRRHTTSDQIINYSHLVGTYWNFVSIKKQSILTFHSPARVPIETTISSSHESLWLVMTRLNWWHVAPRRSLSLTDVTLPMIWLTTSSGNWRGAWNSANSQQWNTKSIVDWLRNYIGWYKINYFQDFNCHIIDNNELTHNVKTVANWKRSNI